MAFLYVIRKVASSALLILQLAMFVRAFMSWFPNMADNAFGDFVYMITEPFIIPARAVMDRIEWVKNAPLDVPFFVTFLIMALIYDMIA